MKIPTLICCVWMLSCGTLLSEIVVGSSKEDVLSEWGTPGTRMMSKGKEVFLYIDGREVQFLDDKVVDIMMGAHGSKKTAPKTTTATIPPPSVGAPAPAKKTGATKTAAAPKAGSETKQPVAPTPAAEPPPPPAETTIEVISDPHPDAPAPAVEAVPAPTPPPPVVVASDVSSLLQQLGNSQQSVYAPAEGELRRLGKSAVPGMVQYYRNPSKPERARRAAMMITGQTLKQEAADIFLVDLTNNSCPAILDLLNFMVSLKDPRAVESLMRLLENSDYASEIRKRTAMALGEIGDPKALNMLILRFRLETDEMAQVEMAKAMDKITGQKHYYEVAARLEWLKKNHPEWLSGPKAGPVSFKVPDKSYRNVFILGGGGFALALALIIWFWKRR